MKEVLQQAGDFVVNEEKNYEGFLDYLKTQALAVGAWDLFARRHADSIKEHDRLHRWVPDHEEEALTELAISKLKK